MANGKVSIRQIVRDLQQDVNVEENFKELFDRYYREVVGFFLKRSFDFEESRDLAQETFCKVFKNINELIRPESFNAWIFSIAKNTYINEVRDRQALKRYTERGQVSIDQVPIEELADVNPGNPSIVDSLVSEERLLEVERRLEQLPPQARRCITLYFDQGLKYREIGDILQISIGTVKSHIHQARMFLRQKEDS
jgi:RNA polymerase sigma-70 factor (ECF subfamily)